ncbi:MAG: shikimate dehydrogenase, partial [Micrococcales bacterium]|nr:shikimate dehydrogenase [Micrococcales bacterium]
VLGCPVAHSLSPVLHQAAYTALGLDGWTYERHEVDEAGLAGFLAALDRSWVGLSLTMPLKRAALALADHAEPTARVVGAANTLLLGPAGCTAANTDVHGIVAAFAETGVTSATTGAVLGGGATSASALAALRGLGVRAPVVVVRSPARAGYLMPLGRHMGLDVMVRAWPVAAAVVATCDVVVSTVPGGTAQLERTLDQVAGTLLDVRYDHGASLAAAWRAAGGAAVGGGRMLVHQAAEQVRLMTGRVAPLDAMDEALACALASPMR